MKNTLKISCFTFAMAFAINANAQSTEHTWSGLYGQLGFLGYGSYMPKQSSGTTTAFNSPIPTVFSANRINGYIGNISLGYNYEINPQFLLGLGSTLYPGTSKTAPTQASTPLGSTHGTYSIADIYSIYLTPAYALNQQQLIYGKIGYTEATTHSSAQGNLMGNFSEQTSHIHGMVYGLGYKQVIAGSIYAFGEVNYAIDKPKHVSITTSDNLIINSTAKASGYDFILGIGYHF